MMNHHIKPIELVTVEDPTEDPTIHWHSSKLNAIFVIEDKTLC